MELMEAILGRRSVRKYKNEQVRQEDLQTILEAARWAPSWANTQCVEYVVVRDPELKAALADTLPDMNPARKAMGQVPLIIAALGKLEKSGFRREMQLTALGDWYMLDIGLAVANLTLTAHSLGYGTVHVGLLDHLKAGEILGVPDDYRVVELIPLGVPDDTPVAPPRRPLEEIVHDDKF